MKIVPAVGLVAATFLLAFAPKSNLKGTWIYAGGYYNGKLDSAPTDYQLQRKYTASSFEAFVVEQGSKPEKFQAGDYTLTTDSCLETETYNAQSTKLTGVTLHYHYEFRNDTLFLKGHLPSGMDVLEYWKKAK
ncbi:hypothetical protein HH214_20560 [Mucilaginibacter robiniae]|uniref:Lipocalin-like domain-containing protein n=1 Tax=Mucilaginibacter robiniae TaxID=2728022 RepID=A0A7L5ECG1_9SPHI|nr:hypothetical protein [Mucilaginibacter robiniae]QJD98096.1 hypothetical protein HH214_20560 [Mucilaginibacter robiniae]